MLHAKGHQRKAVVTNGPISFTATFTEAVTGVSASSLTATDGTVASVSPVDSSHYTIVVNPSRGWRPGPWR
ncbi:Ig-like domain-containing protein [Bradyrhizobium sp.]|jgi:large repetitive protein|uniref:Ig-like domain-containing protein n=1 Tax=Bradyrhizobium sp. TaxID=376 RepID=UPI002D7E7129|nr:Ig-like domain-containing protein [Bradyrhizobium sp.]